MYIASVKALDGSSTPVTERYIAMAILGELQQARSLLENAEPDRTSEFLDLVTRYRERFVDRTEPLSPGTGIRLLDDVVAAYRDYWVRSLLGEGPQSQQDAQLEQALREVLRKRNPAADTMEVYTLLNESLRRLGIGALAVAAPPLQDLFVWRTQRDHVYTVELTDETRVVQVAFMNDFVSLGWKDYAALGLATTTGWVEDGTLYCVEQAYVPGTERFRVSYLKHEARHLADLERFPDLRSVDLEYRAKLTELAFASQTLEDLLDDFTAKSASGSGSPHGEANFRVIHDLHIELYGLPTPAEGHAWAEISDRRVNAAARRLLRRDTEAREGLGDGQQREVPGF